MVEESCEQVDFSTRVDPPEADGEIVERLTCSIPIFRSARSERQTDQLELMAFCIFDCYPDLTFA